mgnify:CR=1 FL=1
MKINGTITTTMDINPLAVIEKLMDGVLDKNEWIKKDNNGFCVIRTNNVYHNRTEDVVIRDMTQTEADYYYALKTVSEYLKIHRT